MKMIQRVRRVTAFVVIALTLLLVMAAGPGGSRALAAKSTTFSGVLYVIWGDSAPGYPAQSPTRYVLADDLGNKWSLEMDNEIIAAAGGILALNRKQVQVSGDPIDDGDTNTLRVQSIALAAGESKAISSSVTASPGTSVAWVTLLCRFADSTGAPPDNLAYFERLIGIDDGDDEIHEPEMDHYWRELSYEEVNLVGSEEYDWEVLPNNRSHYVFMVDPDGPGGDDPYLWADLDALAEDCADVHDGHVDFHDYGGINFIFDDRLDCCAWGGGVTLPNDGSKSYSSTWMPPWGWEQQGVMGHEMGHGFGLPHCSGPYDATYDSQWGVMSDANNAEISPDPDLGPVGVHTISFHKDMLGAIPVARIYTADDSNNQIVPLERLALPGGEGYLMAKIPVGAPDLDFYTAEARKFAGYDTRLGPGEGVVLHAIDEDRANRRPANVVDVDNNGNCNDAAAAWIPCEFFEDTENGISMAVASESTSGFVVVFNPVADVAIEKADNPDPVMAGEQLYYTISVSNYNDGPGSNVVVTDTLPPGVTFITDDLGICTESPPGTLTCDVGCVAGGDSVDITVKVKVDPDLVVNAGGPTAICNDVEVTNDVPDSNLGNNSDTACTIVEDSADLRLTKVCKPDGPLVAGEPGTCTILVDNLGPSDARNVHFTDTNMSDGSFIITTATPSQGDCSINGGIVTCDLEDLEAASTTESGRATVIIAIMALETMDINDVATVVSDTPDPDVTNNIAEGSLSVTAVADLSLSKTDAPDPVTAGETLTYDLTVTNNGPSTAINVLVKDILPAGVSINSVTGDGSCNAGVPGDPFLPTTCAFDSLLPTHSKTMQIVVTVLPETLGLIHNDARVSSDTADLNNSNDLVTVATQVNAVADLAVAKTDHPDPVVAGMFMTYEVSIRNDGPSLARDVALTDQLPNGVSLTETTISGGTGTCVLLEDAPNTVSCQLNDLAPGGSVLVYLNVLVASSVPHGTTLTNTAIATSSASDPVPGNNTASADTSVEAVADLAIQKTSDQDVYKPSSTVEYTITVVNNGASDALDVVVTDELPERKVVGYYVYDNGGCAVTETTLTCLFGTVPAGASEQFQMRFYMQHKGLATNTASVASSTYDPELGNNTSVREIFVGKPKY